MTIKQVSSRLKVKATYLKSMLRSQGDIMQRVVEDELDTIAFLERNL